MFYQNYFAMRNTAAVRGGKPIAIWSQSISGVNAVNSLVAFYDIRVKNREELFFYLHSYYSRFIPEGIAEASKILPRDTFYQNYLAVRNLLLNLFL
jgi:hypothetical protein